MSMRIAGSIAVTLCTVLLGMALAPVSAAAWVDEFFDGGASGQAVYESMAIHPQAVRAADGSTFVVYQGAGLDPYVIRLSPSGAWQGPVKIGENPLTETTREPDDTHGAPSLVIDANGYLHVFWGAHLSRMKHARSASPLDISAWVQDQPVPPHSATYPQPYLRADGTIMMSYRLDKDWSTYKAGSWMLAEFTNHGSTFSTSTAILAGDNTTIWYGHTRPGPTGRLHGVFIGKEKYGTAYWRANVYYVYKDPGDVWRDAASQEVTAANPQLGITYAELTAPGLKTLVRASAGERQNQAVVAADSAERPGILYTSGGGFGPTSYRWEYASFDGSEWNPEPVVSTDHSFDSGALSFDSGDLPEVFVTTGGSPGAGPTDTSYEDRGGSIVRFRVPAAGAPWSKEQTIAAANWTTGTLFNDPQVVEGATSGQPRLLFGEWNNDGANFVHKVMLWGDGGYHGREFFPALTRVAGKDRYEVAADISRRSFPVSARTDLEKHRYAVLVSGAKFPDALSGGPLATAYGAPILLTESGRLPDATKQELVRLKCDRVFVLGGTASVSDAVVSQLKTTGLITKVTRLGGRDRYETAASIATELAKKTGPPSGAFVVSGEVFPDGLAAGSVAAARSWPVLLVRQNQLPSATGAALKSSGVTKTYVVGGPNTVSADVVSQLPSATRISGKDRYEAAANLAEVALDGLGSLPPTLKTNRLFVASGEVYPDALSGSAWAARVRGPLLLASSEKLPQPSDSFLRRRAFRVIDCYILGGERSVGPAVADSIASALLERQYD